MVGKVPGHTTEIVALGPANPKAAEAADARGSAMSVPGRVACVSNSSVPHLASGIFLPTVHAVCGMERRPNRQVPAAQGELC